MTLVKRFVLFLFFCNDTIIFSTMSLAASCTCAYSSYRETVISLFVFAKIVLCPKKHLVNFRGYALFSVLYIASGVATDLVNALLYFNFLFGLW